MRSESPFLITSRLNVSYMQRKYDLCMGWLMCRPIASWYGDPSTKLARLGKCICYINTPKMYRVYETTAILSFPALALITSFLNAFLSWWSALLRRNNYLQSATFRTIDRNWEKLKAALHAILKNSCAKSYTPTARTAFEDVLTTWLWAQAAHPFFS